MTKISYQLIPLFILCACHIELDWVNGSGNVVAQEIEVQEFERLRLEGIGEVIFTQEAFAPVMLVGEDNILDHIEVSVEDRELVIEREPGFNLWPSKEVLILVSAPGLETITNSGDGDITGDGTIEGSGLQVILEGSGNIELDLDLESLDSSLFGSGDVLLNGRATSHNVGVTGSGNIEAFELQTQHSAVEISGSGGANVYAIDSLEAVIYGSGDVVYEGTPTVSSQVEGSGSVSRR